MVTKSVNGSNVILNQNDSSVQKKLGQQDFLRLMVAQIQNQAVQPQINSDFLSQLDKFSANNGTVKMHESLQQMATSLQSNQALQASAFVGRKVLIDSDTLKLDAEGDIKTAVEVPPGCSKLCASIYRERGELIKTISLGQPEPGFFQFNWDGTTEDGIRVEENNYKVEVHAVYQEKKLLLPTMTFANVDSVSLDQNGEGLKLNVAGVGAISLDQVRQISV